MADKKIVEEWLAKADEDLGFAKSCLSDEENEFYSPICFHFQQSAEKYLKSYIVAFGLEFKKIHDLVQLLQVCSAHNPSLEGLKENCEFLTDFYVETRYPVHWPTNIIKADAEQAREAAEKIAQKIKDTLSE